VKLNYYQQKMNARRYTREQMLRLPTDEEFSANLNWISDVYRQKALGKWKRQYKSKWEKEPVWITDVKPT
jgi:hypothetical protein